MNVLITYDVKSTLAQHPFRELDGTLPLYESYLERPYDIVGRIVIFYQTFFVDFRMTSKYTRIDGYQNIIGGYNKRIFLTINFLIHCSDFHQFGERYWEQGKEKEK